MSGPAPLGAGILGAVLAGGASSRFGSDKAMALVGGETMLARAHRALAPFVPMLVTVGRARGAPDVPAPGLGPLGGIAGALAHAKALGFGSVLTIGCDMPAVPPALLAAMIARAPCYCPDAPVIGHWPTGLADELRDYLAPFAGSAGKVSGLSIRRWAQMVGAAAVPSPVPLVNVNTPADLPA